MALAQFISIFVANSDSAAARVSLAGMLRVFPDRKLGKRSLSDKGEIQGLFLFIELVIYGRAKKGW
jgi:hypothetical protein